MKVKFTRNYVVKSADGEAYKEGKVYDLPDASANHFIARGAAEPVEAPRAAGAAAEDDADATPDFDSMTKADLQAFAEQNQIDGVTSSMTKDEMVKTVSKASRKSR